MSTPDHIHDWIEKTELQRNVCECGAVDPFDPLSQATLADFEIAGVLSGRAYVNAEADPKQSTVELQVGRGFRSLSAADAEALGAWLQLAADELRGAK